MGDELFKRYLEAFEEDAPVSIRLNPAIAENKVFSQQFQATERVPWCRDGYYLPKRPAFTFDPLLHAGRYYVQEAASMFLDHVLHHLHHPSPITHHPSPTTHHLPPITHHPSNVLDLCAAPGGKSTIILSHLPEGSTFVSNEPNPKRAQILSENLQKWQLSGLKVKSEKLKVFVSNGFPKDVRRAKIAFDMILCDVPCSGEGMFRKDADSIGEWSVENVEKCWRLQREIVEDAWAMLRAGGHLIYSTCTLNTKENEENVRWMMEQFDAEPVVIPVEADWCITGSLLPDFSAPVYRFIPGVTRGEGLFMAVLKKKGETEAKTEKKQASLSNLKLISNDFLNEIDEALRQQAPIVSLTYEQAIQYLRREAIVLPSDTPRGIVVVAFEGHTLGLAKNVGNRANNLYPKEWRIKSTHIPKEYEAIFRHS